jgi:DNA-binding MarR family transcriptional regulator
MNGTTHAGHLTHAYGDAAILIVADTAHGADAATVAVEAGAPPPFPPLSSDGVPPPPHDLVSVDAIYAELDSSAPEQLRMIADAVHGEGGSGTANLVVAVPLRHLDHFGGYIAAPDTALLCEPTLADRVIALELALGGRTDRFHDTGGQPEAERLRRLADEVGRIARTLTNLSANAPVTAPYGAGVSDVQMGFRMEPGADDLPGAMPDAAALRMMIRLRRLRDQFFPADLFADPAWDILLDLMAARLEQVQVAVSSLCIAAAVPPTTALRWISKMTEEALLERVADATDGRRIFIRLTDSAANSLARYFSAAAGTRAPNI